MNVVFLTLGNFNSINDYGLYTDLLREFKENGHSVYVVTPLERRLGKETSFYRKDDVSYLRVKTGNITKVNKLEKGISTLMIEHQFLSAIKKYLNSIKFDLVIYSTPPVTFEKIIKYLKKKDSAKAYLLLKDIFPQNAVDLGMFSKRNPIYRYFRRKERNLYEISDYIGCMSQANVDFVIQNNPYIPANKVEVCPNSIKPRDIEINSDMVPVIRKKYNIPLDKTIFVYGGNLGEPQGIDFLLDCIQYNKNNNKVYFLIVGSGTKYDKIREFITNKNIKNAQLRSYMRSSEYELLISSCDVGLIFLNHRFTIPNFPSRLLSYMQVGMPVLAATDPNTDLGDIIEQGKFGFWCESNDVEAFYERISKLCDSDLREKLGRNAKQYLEDNYTSKKSYEIIMKHFN